LQDAYLKQFKKGILEIVVLKLLEGREQYGYELISALNEKSRFLEVREGTLYPLLYRLEDEKLIDTRWQQAPARGVPKKYYAITPKGRQVLAEVSETWFAFSAEVGAILKGEGEQP